MFALEISFKEDIHKLEIIHMSVTRTKRLDLSVWLQKTELVPMSRCKKKVELNYPRIEWVAFLSLGEDIQIVDE